MLLEGLQRLLFFIPVLFFYILRHRYNAFDPSNCYPEVLCRKVATMPQQGEPDVVTVVIMPPLKVSNHKWLRHDHHDHKYSSSN